jgi:hypothetical protein
MSPFALRLRFLMYCRSWAHAAGGIFYIIQRGGGLLVALDWSKVAVASALDLDVYREAYALGFSHADTVLRRRCERGSAAISNLAGNIGYTNIIIETGARNGSKKCFKRLVAASRGTHGNVFNVFVCGFCSAEFAGIAAVPFDRTLGAPSCAVFRLINNLALRGHPCNQKRD